jgi:Zn-dependent M28 family amino/carboxypeptidase
VYDVVTGLQEQCTAVDGLECEVWWQQGDGSHRFNILDHDVLKTYSGLSNIILRISNGSEVAKQSALLLNAHIDSAITGPGSSDDGVGVGIMLEIARIMVERKRTIENAVIFCETHCRSSELDNC